MLLRPEISWIVRKYNKEKERINKTTTYKLPWGTFYISNSEPNATLKVWNLQSLHKIQKICAKMCNLYCKGGPS